MNNKYIEIVDISKIEIGMEFTTLAKLFKAVGFPKYINMLDKVYQDLALQEALADKGLKYEKLKNSYKVVIVRLWLLLFYYEKLWQ